MPWTLTFICAALTLDRIATRMFLYLKARWQNFLLAGFLIGMAAIAATYTHRRQLWESSYADHLQGLTGEPIPYHVGISTFERLTFENDFHPGISMDLGHFLPQRFLNIAEMLFASGIEHQPGPAPWTKLAALMPALFTGNISDRKAGSTTFVLDVGNITNIATHIADLCRNEADAMVFQEILALLPRQARCTRPCVRRDAMQYWASLIQKLGTILVG